MRTTLREKAILWMVGLPVALLLAAAWNSPAVSSAIPNTLIVVVAVTAVGGAVGAFVRTRETKRMAR